MKPYSLICIECKKLKTDCFPNKTLGNRNSRSSTTTKQLTYVAAAYVEVSDLTLVAVDLSNVRFTVTLPG